MTNCPEWLQAFLEHIEAELDRVMWNKNQEEYQSPFQNTGNSFQNDTFLVRAYDWGWDFNLDSGGSGLPSTPAPQPVNFKWKDVDVRWYKHLSRMPELNREVTPDEGIEMMDECIASLRAGEDLDF
jgi:hypothetical protein